MGRSKQAFRKWRNRDSVRVSCVALRSALFIQPMYQYKPGISPNGVDAGTK